MTDTAAIRFVIDSGPQPLTEIVAAALRRESWDGNAGAIDHRDDGGITVALHDSTDTELELTETEYLEILAASCQDAGLTAERELLLSAARPSG